MPKISQGLDAGGRGDVKMGAEIGLERFQAQLSSTQMGNPRLQFARFPNRMGRSGDRPIASVVVVGYPVVVGSPGPTTLRD